MDHVDPVITAIRNDRGLASRLAEKLGITREAVWLWKKVPPRHVLAVAKFFRWHPHVIRPDLYHAPRKRRVNIEGKR